MSIGSRAATPSRRRAPFFRGLDFIPGEPRLEPAADDRDRRRNRAVFADDALDVQRRLDVLG